MNPSIPVKRINNSGTLSSDALAELKAKLFGDPAATPPVAGLIAGVTVANINGQIQINPENGAYSFPTSS